jgi:hypothetical protein
MSKTKRKYLDGMSLKKNALEKQAKQDREKLKREFITNGEKINIRHNLPESWDDRPIAALSETKHIWKNGVEIKKEEDYYNVYFINNFVVNLDYEQLKMFPWTAFLPIDAPPNLADFKLV